VDNFSYQNSYPHVRKYVDENMQGFD